VGYVFVTAILLIGFALVGNIRNASQVTELGFMVLSVVLNGSSRAHANAVKLPGLKPLTSTGF